MDYKKEYNKLRGEVYRLNKHIEELENSSFVETLVDKYESKISKLTNKLDVSNKNVTKYKEKYIILLKRLKEYKYPTLYFLDNPLVAYNNNLSERLLREVKRKMKQVTTLRSDNNLSYYLDGLSIIKTAKANDINIYQKLIAVFENG